MSPDDLARWLVEQPWWEWRPGMLIVDDAGGHSEFGFRVHDVRTVQGQQQVSRGMGWTVPALWDNAPSPRPDLTDPATVGALVGMARDAYLDVIVVSIGNGWWSVETEEHEWDHDNTASLAEALGKAIAARRAP